MTDLYPAETPPAFRFRSRHALESIARYLKQQLIAYKWGDAALPLTDAVNTNINFHGTPVTYLSVTPDESGTDVAPNTVVVSLEGSSRDDEQELGANYGGLYAVTYSLYVDVYGESMSVARSIADDVKVLLAKGRYLTVFDFSASPPVATTEQIQFDDIVGPDRPPAALNAPTADFRRRWFVVSGLAVCYFTADRDGWSDGP